MAVLYSERTANSEQRIQFADILIGFMIVLQFIERANSERRTANAKNASANGEFYSLPYQMKAEIQRVAFPFSCTFCIVFFYFKIEEIPNKSSPPFCARFCYGSGNSAFSCPCVSRIEEKKAQESNTLL